MALQWVVIVALGSVAAYLFRQLTARYDKTVEMLQQQHAVAQETAAAMREIAEALRTLERTIGLEERLRQAVEQKRKDGE